MPPPRVPVLFLHGLCFPSQPDRTNQIINNGIIAQIRFKLPFSLPLFGSKGAEKEMEIVFRGVDFAGLLSKRQKATWDLVFKRTDTTTAGPWQTLRALGVQGPLEWARKIPMVLVNQAMSFHSNQEHRRNVYFAISDAISSLAQEMAIDTSKDTCVPFTVIAYSMGSSIAIEFLSEFFWWNEKRGLEALGSPDLEFSCYAQRLGEAGIYLLTHLAHFVTFGSPMLWQYPHVPNPRVLPAEIEWTNFWYSSDVLSSCLNHLSPLHAHINDIELSSNLFSGLLSMIFSFEIGPFLTLPPFTSVYDTLASASFLKKTPISHVLYFWDTTMFKTIVSKIRGSLNECSSKPLHVEYDLDFDCCQWRVKTTNWHDTVRTHIFGAKNSLSEGPWLPQPNDGELIKIRQNFFGYTSPGVFVLPVPPPEYSPRVKYLNLDDFIAYIYSPKTDLHRTKFILLFHVHGQGTRKQIWESEIPWLERNTLATVAALNREAPVGWKIQVLLCVLDYSDIVEYGLHTRWKGCGDMVSAGNRGMYGNLRGLFLEEFSFIMGVVTEPAVQQSVEDGIRRGINESQNKMRDLLKDKGNFDISMVFLSSALGTGLLTLQFGAMHNEGMQAPFESRDGDGISFKFHKNITLGSHLSWIVDTPQVDMPKFGLFGKFSHCPRPIFIGVSNFDAMDSGYTSEETALHVPVPMVDASLGRRARDVTKRMPSTSKTATKTMATTNTNTILDVHQDAIKAHWWISIFYSTDILSTSLLNLIPAPAAALTSLHEIELSPPTERTGGAKYRFGEGYFRSIGAALCAEYLRDPRAWEVIGEVLRCARDKTVCGR